MENEDEIRKIIEKSKRINEEQGQKNPVGRPKKQPAPTPAPAPALAPAPASDKLEISQDDYKMLINLAKKNNEPQPRQISNVIERQPPAYTEPVLVADTEFVGAVDEGSGYSDIMANPMVLYFDTDRTCSVINAKIKKNGSVDIGERTFDFAEAQPSILRLGGKGKKKTHPFYIIKYSNTNPVDIAEFPESIPTPEETNRLVNLKTLETLSRITGGKIGKMPLILMLLIGFAIGFVAKIMLQMTGVW